MIRPLSQNPPQGVTYVTCNDGIVWVRRRLRCLGLAIAQPSQVVHDCLEGPGLQRAEALSKLTRAQYWELFPTDCGCSRGGTNHRKEPESLLRFWRNLHADLLADDETRAQLEALPLRRLLYLGAVVRDSPQETLEAQVAALASLHLRRCAPARRISSPLRAA